MAFVPRPEEIYRHFKGNLYRVVTVAEHTETGEKLVIYQALYGEFKTYARPLLMFVSRVDKEKYPECTQEFRFALQGQEAERQRLESENEDAEKKKKPFGNAVENHVAASEKDIGKVMEVSADNKATENCEKEAFGTEGFMTENTEAESPLDPGVLEFLDAKNYEERLNILAMLHHRITDEMITTMAIACDLEVDQGDTEERYESLKNCLLTLEKYETTRLR